MLDVLAAQQQEVTAWPQRLLLTAIVIAVIGLSCLGMWRSWHKRARQTLPVREVPQGFTATLEVPGQYLGTSPADNWMRRIVANGMGAPGLAQAQVGPEGILLTRRGETDIFIAADQVRGTELGRGVAAEVAEKDGVVLWFWDAGSTPLQTGFRPDAAQDVARLLGAGHQFVIQEDA